MQSNLAVNKYLHTVASCWISSNQHRCLDSMVSYEKEVGIDNKLNNYLKIAGVKTNALRPQKTLKKRRVKLSNTLAVPVLLYGSENWTRDARRITSAEIKYMRTTAGYICTDYKTSTEIAKGLNITPVLDKVKDYRRNWVWKVNRMPRKKITQDNEELHTIRQKDLGEQRRDFWMCASGTGQQVAQLRGDSYMMMMMKMTSTDDSDNLYVDSSAVFTFVTIKPKRT